MFRSDPVPPTRPAGGLVISTTVERLLVAACLFWVLAANRAFFSAALEGRSPTAPSTWGFGLALALIVGAGQYLLVVPLAYRFTVKPLLALMAVASAGAWYFMQAYGVYLDPSMLRNVMRSDVAEASELLSWNLVVHLLLYAGLPILLLTRVRIVRRPWPRAVAWRLGSIALALLVLLGALFAVFQPMASLMRNHKEVRYLITPANLLWSGTVAVARETRGAGEPRVTIGEDAAPGPRMAARRRPLVLVLVVGETARAANWGLDGYARQTTPSLARLPVVNFADVEACGTNTETSLPCMFAPVGRRDYDEARIRGSDSLLHVLARAGVGVYWRDNQSGCKGVCDDLPSDSVATLRPLGLCNESRCLDEGLLSGLDRRLASATGTQVWVLHMLGNHGPSYFRRYPPAFEHFTPACRDDDLQRCSRDQIVNAYDNALLYTDHVLASLVAKLQAQSGRVDGAMLFVSDHGESLGENNLYLHGLPYAIAPKEQTQVPMVMWLSDGAWRAAGLEASCLRRRAAAPVTHDHLFHTVLGLLDVKTSLYEPEWDLGARCREAKAREAS